MELPENRLTFIRFDHFKEYIRPVTGYREKIVFNLYQCSCGNQKVIRRLLVNSKSRSSTFSCGCLRAENLKKINELGLNKHRKLKGVVAHNKGKVCIKQDGRNKYVTIQELKEIYYEVNTVL